MKNKDTKMLAEAYENLYAGIVDDNDSEKDEDSKGHKDSDKEEKAEKKVDKDEPDEDASDEEKEEHEESESDEMKEKEEEATEDDSEESDDEESDDEESDEESDDEESDDDSEESEGDESAEGAGGDKGVQSKIKALQKQYNDIMMDAFTKYAPECIESALENSEGAFGEDIENILQSALDSLKTKILGDFGIESPEGTIDISGSMSPDVAGKMFGPFASDEGDEDESGEESDDDEETVINLPMV